MKELALSFLIALILFSCGKSKSSQNDIDTSELEDVVLSNDNKIYLHDAICDIEAIPLESSDKVLIGNIDHIILTEEYIIVCDSRTSKSVYVFDRNGKHHSTINRVGRGPQEYIAIHHVALLPDNETIAINDNNSRKILYFDLDGHFISAVPVPFWIATMEYIDENNVLCTTYGQGKSDPGLAELDNPDNLVYFTDDKYNIKKGFLPNRYDRDKFSFVSYNLKKYGKDIYLYPVYTGIFYKMEDYGLKAIYRLNLDKIGGTVVLAPNITNEEFSQLRMVTFAGFFTISDDFMHLWITQADRTFTNYLYSRNTKKSYLIEKDLKYRDDLLVSSIGPTHTQSKSKFVTYIEAQYIVNKGNELIKQRPELAGVKEDDNPVIVLYRFKEGL